jgi:hypothetical protein
MTEVLGRSDTVGRDDARQPGGDGRRETVMRVLDGYCGSRVDAHRRARGRVDIGPRFRARHVVTSTNCVDTPEQTESLEVGFDPISRRARCHRDRHAGLLRAIEEIDHTRANALGKGGGVLSRAALRDHRVEVEPDARARVART